MRSKVLSAVLGLGLLTGSVLAAAPAQAVIGTPIPRDESISRVAAGNNLGTALGPVRTGLKDGGAYRQYQRGFVVYSISTAAHVSRGAIRSVYGKLGYENGRLGYPLTDEVVAAGGTYQQYQNGTVAWTSAGGAHALVGAIRTEWTSTGGVNGPLGAPLTDEVTGLKFGGASQTFRGGAVVWSSLTGAQVTKGAIRAAWLKTDAQNGNLGYPTTGEMLNPDGVIKQQFMDGHIIWTAKTGAIVTVYPQHAP